MSHLNIQQKVSKTLAQKHKDTKGKEPALSEEEARKLEFENDIKPNLSEELYELLQKLLEKLSHIGRYTEFDIYNLMKKYDFQVKVIEEITSVMVQKAKEAENADFKPVTRGKSKAPEKDDKKNERDNERKKSKRRTENDHDGQHENGEQRGFQKSFRRTQQGRNTGDYYQDDHYDNYHGRYNNEYNGGRYNDGYNRYNNKRYGNYDNYGNRNQRDYDNYDNRKERSGRRNQDRNTNRQEETMPSLMPIYVAKSTSEETHHIIKEASEQTTQHTPVVETTTQPQPQTQTQTHTNTVTENKAPETTHTTHEHQQPTHTHKEKNTNAREDSNTNKYQRGRQQKMYVAKKKTEEQEHKLQPESVQQTHQEHAHQTQGHQQEQTKQHYNQHNIHEFFQKSGEKTKLDPRDQVDYIDSVIHPPKNRVEEKSKPVGLSNEQDKTSQTAQKPTIDKTSHHMNGHHQPIGSHRTQTTQNTTSEHEHKQTTQNQSIPPGFMPFNSMGFPQPQTVPTKDLASLFQVPYIVIPQPNGTSIIQPLYIPQTTQGGFQQPPFMMYPQGFPTQQPQNTSDNKHSHDNKTQSADAEKFFNFNEDDKFKKSQNQQQTNTQQPYMYPFVYPGAFPMGFVGGQQGNSQGKH